MNKTTQFIGFVSWMGCTMWLFILDWRVAICVTLITLSIRKELMFLADKNK